MKRFLQTTLFATLTSLTLASQAANTANTNPSVNISPAERAKIEQVVHDYLLQKPEIIIEAVQSFQQKQYQQAEQTVKQTQQTASNYATPLFHQANDPVAGNPNGKVTIVEFFDYQCQHCEDMAPVLAAIIKANPDVRIVFKEFPIRGPLSDFAARVALAANKQGKYYELNHALLTAKDQLSQEKIYDIAKSVGLNVDQLKKDMNDKSIDDQIKTNMKLGQNLKLFGTPAFFVGKTNASGSGSVNYVPGQVDQNQLQSMIDKVNQ